MPRGTQGRSLWPQLKGEPYPKQEFESIYAEVGFGGMHYTEKDNIPETWAAPLARLARSLHSTS